MKEKHFPSISELTNDPWISLWLIRFGLYVDLFGIVALLGLLIIKEYHVFWTNTNNSLYFLSSMVQAQAAIVALVITLTLIAIQMTAGSYTPRVVDVMKRNPDMWFLLVIYIESISIGFIALKLLADDGDRSLVSMILILGIYSFLTLFLYLINTIKLLRPDEVVKMLVGDINAENLKHKKGTDDILQPVFDVVQASISRFDVTTTRTGLNQLSLRITELLPTFEDRERDRIAEQFCNHIQRSSLIALRNEDEGTISEILTILETFGLEICKYPETKKGSRQVIWVVQFIGKHAVEKRLLKAVLRVSDTLGVIGTCAADKRIEYATVQVIKALEKMGTQAVDKELEDASIWIVDSLAGVGKHAADNGLEDISQWSINALGTIGEHVADKGLSPETMYVAHSLGNLGAYSADRGLEEATIHAIESLENIGKHAAATGMEYPLVRVVNHIETVGKHAAIKGLEYGVICVAKSLGSVGAYAADKGIKNATIEIVNTLDKISENFTDNGFEEATNSVVDSLGSVGKHAADNGQQKATLLAAAVLEKVGIRSARNGLWAGTSAVVGEDYVMLAANQLAVKMRLGPFSFHS